MNLEYVRMPRLPDPSRLPPPAAIRVRELIRRIRKQKAVTNAQLAEAVEETEWSERRVTDALTEGRPLLAVPAYELLMAALHVRPNSTDRPFEAAQLVLQFWATAAGDDLRRLRTRATIGDPPAPALIPIKEFQRLADEITLLMFPNPRARARRRVASRRIVEHLERTNYRRTILWEQSVTRDVHAIVDRVENCDLAWHFPYQRNSCGGNHIAVGHVAEEGVRFAADLCCGRPHRTDRR